MPPSSSPMSRQEREQFLGEMTAQERETFARLAAAMREKDRDLPWYRSFGKGVLDLRGADEAAGRYGWMTRLASALGCSTSLLNKTRHFARQYSAPEARALAREGINWGMVFPTFPVEGKQEQLAWMRRAKLGGWTVDRLLKEVQKVRGGPQRKGGRQRRAPRSYGRGVDLRELLRETDQWLRCNQEVWSAEGAGLLVQLAAVPPEQYTTDLAKQLREAEVRLERLVREASELRGQLKRLRETVRRGLSGRDA